MTIIKKEFEETQIPTTEKTIKNAELKKNKVSYKKTKKFFENLLKVTLLNSAKKRC